jgi:hypothetical protein
MNEKLTLKKGLLACSIQRKCTCRPPGLDHIFRNNVKGLVTATIDEPRGGKANQLSCSDGILPMRRRFGSEGPQR